MGFRTFNKKIADLLFCCSQKYPNNHAGFTVSDAWECRRIKGAKREVEFEKSHGNSNRKIDYIFLPMAA
jgi:hypothetical protein